MQRIERLPLLFPLVFVCVAACKECGIWLCFLVSCFWESRIECEGARNVRIRTVSIGRDEPTRDVTEIEITQIIVVESVADRISRSLLQFQGHTTIFPASPKK